MYSAVEFVRVPSEENGARSGPVFIVPEYVVKVEQYGYGQTVDSLITLVDGEPETVVGPPSEINVRLRRGQ